MSNFEVPSAPKQEKTPYPKRLYHVSAWGGLTEKKVGDSFVLEPGPQHAEGRGVYFSEEIARPEAADSVAKTGEPHKAIISIEVNSPKLWWRSKNANTKKHDRPRTWHTQGKQIRCRVKSVENIGGVVVLNCDWEFI